MNSIPRLLFFGHSLLTLALIAATPGPIVAQETRLAAYHESIRLNPKLADAHTGLGNALRERGDRDGAISAYRKTLDVAPGFAEAQISLRSIEQESSGAGAQPPPNQQAAAPSADISPLNREAVMAFARVTDLWQSGQREEVWKLYQNQSRQIGGELVMLDPKRKRSADARREAAHLIGSQLDGESIRQDLARRSVGPADYPQWGGWAGRNNASLATSAPTDWNPGEFERKTGAWKPEKAKNIKWVAALGSQTYGNPTVANGKIFVGTNNSNGYLRRYPADIDLGVLLCFRESDGAFLWQHSCEKLPTGRVHDWPLQGICSSPLLEGDRVWLVTNRGEVVCLDAEGFYDDEDDGPVQGIRGDLFRVHTHLHSTLGEYWVNQKFKDALVKAGLKLPPSPFVQKAAAGSRWIIYERIPGDSQPVQHLQIDLIRDDLHIVRVEAGVADSPPAVVIRDALWDGLGTPAIVQSLRPEFAKAGLELRADIEVRTTEEGRAWAFDLITADGRIEVVVRHVQDRLIASHTSLRKSQGKQEADVVWSLDMMKELGVSQHNMCTCAPTAWGNVLFICTSNGVDEAHMRVPAPQAPSFIALDKHTGKILWTDNSPGENIQHGQWSPPAVGVFAGVPQVIFCGGDGWVYSFHAEVWRDGKPNLLWKFDTNPKDTVLELGGRGTRNEPIAVPVIYDGLVYVTTGQDPEHGEGTARIWCIDPTRRGDVSPQLVVLASDRNQIVPHRRMKAADPERGEVVIDNQNSAVVWQYARLDTNGDGKLDFEEQFHRAIASVVIKDDILVTIDFSGLAHCLNAKSGGRYWACDMLAAGWGTPLIVGTHIYVPDEDGDIAILELDPRFDRSGKLQPDDRPPFIGSSVPQREINMVNSVYSTPIFANGVLYIANKDHLFAIVPNPSPDQVPAATKPAPP